MEKPPEDDDAGAKTSATPWRRTAARGDRVDTCGSAKAATGTALGAPAVVADRCTVGVDEALREDPILAGSDSSGATLPKAGEASAVAAPGPKLPAVIANTETMRNASRRVKSDRSLGTIFPPKKTHPACETKWIVSEE